VSAIGEIPNGMQWCPDCNGYGSSLSEDSARCSRCGGTGLIADDGRSDPPRSPRHAERDVSDPAFRSKLDQLQADEPGPPSEARRSSR
jgi:hypothetical protein